MTPFAADQYIMLALVFVLGLVLGMYLMSGGKWKHRYREEVRRRETLERELRRTEPVPAGDIVIDNRRHRHHGDTAAAPLSATEAPPVRRRGGLWGFGRAKH